MDINLPITAPTTDSSANLAISSIFDSIALSMSGGGFRAAAYALGTLRGLHLLSILSNVTVLSTISGGTISGAYYALRRKRGDDFDLIYNDLYALLAADDLLPKALADWKAAIKSQQQQYKLIQAFANVYDQCLYDSARFNEFFIPNNGPLSTPPFQTVIFGATELYSGTAFRFQYADLPEKFTTPDNVLRPSYRIGNGNVCIRPERVRNLRLSDMVAASSCFPAGFEPLVLPDDFPTEDKNNLVFFSGTDAQLPIQRLALLDGGIYDNQGIEGLVGAERRNQAYRESPEGKAHAQAGGILPRPTSLFLIADVASAGMGLYETPAPGPVRGSERSFKRWSQLISKVIWGLLVAFLIVGLVQLGARHGGSFGMGILAGIILSGLGLLVAGSWAIQQLGNKLKTTSPTLWKLALPPLQSLTIGQLLYLLRVRVSSVFELLNSVFLRRVRSLNYNLLYDDDSETSGKSTSAIVISSIIGSILKDYQVPFFRSRLQPIIDTIQTASDMSTTLWWLSDKHRMEAVIESAQITLFWRIVRHFDHQKYQAKNTNSIFTISAQDMAIYNKAKQLLDNTYHVK